MQFPPPADSGTRAAQTLALVTGLFLRLTEAGFAFVGFIVLVHILLGAEAGPYVGSVIANLTGLVAAIGSQALVGVAIVLALLYAVRRKS
jgi:hypothetical protein